MWQAQTSLIRGRESGRTSYSTLTLTKESDKTLSFESTKQNKQRPKLSRILIAGNFFLWLAAFRVVSSDMLSCLK